jgi:uncharacterized NAD(P)/FAD-binding protein YdhS
MSTGKAEPSPLRSQTAAPFSGAAAFSTRAPKSIEANVMSRTHPHICVIGGGFTGAAAAIACLRRISEPFRLTIVEPGAALGQGVAFGGAQPLHLLNVRTRDLSIHTDRPHDYLNWAFAQLDQGENDSGLHEGLAHSFLPRHLFGAYVRQRLFEAIERRNDVATKIVNDAALSCSRRGGSFVVRTENSEPLFADIVMLATAYGMRTASAAGALGPYDVLAPELLMKAKSIALIGSGLTMVDALVSARRDGFKGKATIISRRGQLPRAHAAQGVKPLEVALPRSRSMARLTEAVRIACEAAVAHGTPWQAVFNGLRPRLQDFWQNLPIQEQARFLRHVRPFWDAHRHRLPSDVHARVVSEFREGRAVLLRARVIEVARKSDGFELKLKRRGSTDVERLLTDLAFDCSGHKPDLTQPLVQSLMRQGNVRPDPHRLGLAVEADGRLIGKSGAIERGLFALGPLCQGTIWEITAVPEIVRQADAAANAIRSLLESRHADRMDLQSA